MSPARIGVRQPPGCAAHQGDAGHGEPIETEAVCDRGNVSDAVHHSPAAEAIGAAVAGPVVGDHARSDTRIRAREAWPGKARAGRAMKEEDREPIRVAALGDRQRPPIGRRHRLRARRPSHDGIILRRVHGGKLHSSGDISWTLAQARLRVTLGVLGGSTERLGAVREVQQKSMCEADCVAEVFQPDVLVWGVRT